VCPETTDGRPVLDDRTVALEGSDDMFFGKAAVGEVLAEAASGGFDGWCWG
jgi:hypothetical protein